MAGAFSAASSQHLSLATAPATATPLTLACWFRTADPTGSNKVLLGLWDSGVAEEGWYISQVAAASKVEAVAVDSGSYGVATSTAGISANTWHHITGVFSAGNSRTIYLDAGSNASETTVLNPASIDNLKIGVFGNPLVAYATGDIAECAVWDVALTLEEITSLARAFSPLFIRPTSLKFYAPLVRDFKDHKSVALTNTNTVTVATHPRIIYPSRRQAFSVAAAAPASAVGHYYRTHLMARRRSG